MTNKSSGVSAASKPSAKQSGRQAAGQASNPHGERRPRSAGAGAAEKAEKLFLQDPYCNSPSRILVYECSASIVSEEQGCSPVLPLLLWLLKLPPPAGPPPLQTAGAAGRCPPACMQTQQHNHMLDPWIFSFLHALSLELYKCFRTILLITSISM